MKKCNWLLVLAGLVIVVQLGAEEIQLKDGTKVTGKIVGVSGETFQVKTAYGDINIPRSQVISITFPENTLPRPARRCLWGAFSAHSPENAPHRPGSQRRWGRWQAAEQH